jgi:hypothetical protein
LRLRGDASGIGDRPIGLQDLSDVTHGDFERVIGCVVDNSIECGRRICGASEECYRLTFGVVATASERLNDP